MSITRDRWGRYVLPDPNTGKDRAWTRVTTISGAVKDRFALEKWAQRNTVWGIARRHNLVAQAASLTLDDAAQLNDIVRRAQEAANSQAGADIGSAIHAFTELVDRGEEPAVPPAYSADVAAYTQARDSAGLEVVPGMIERIVCIPELGVAGTFDRVYTGPWPGEMPRIGDIKTAADKTRDGRTTNNVLEYGSVDIPIQLALYAHATHMWTGREWNPMPEVDQERAVVMHIPAGSGICRVCEVDIETGWDIGVELATGIREWQRRKNLIHLISQATFDDRDATLATGDDSGHGDGPPPVPVSTPTLDARRDWLRGRVDAIKACTGRRSGMTAAQLLARWWSEHPTVPTFKHGGPATGDDIDLIARLCDRVEADFNIPFGPSDPTN